MQAADEADYLEYVKARWDRLRRFGYLCCGDWHRAEDAVQETFVKLYRRWHKAKRESLDGYVRRILVNSLIDAHRLAWFRRERSTDTIPDRTANGRTADDAGRQVDVMSALARLSDRQRTVVVLRYWEDLSVDQTAKIMRTTPGTVKSQSSRALRTLRGLLSEHDIRTSQGATL